MIASRNIIWSEEKFSLIELLHSSHSLEYPLLVKVVQGHYDSRTEDNYDPEQIFVFYGWGKQERVLAENVDKVSISIPTSHKHKLSVHIYDAEQSKHRVNRRLSSIMSEHSPPVRVEFDPRVTTIFNVGSTLFNSNDFSPMLLKSSHLLRYVKCSPISQGKINMDALHVLPTTLSLTCVVARTLRNGLDLGTVLKGVQEDAAFLMDSPVDQKLVGICSYSHLVPQKDEDYELIEDIPAGPWGSKLGFKCQVTKTHIPPPRMIDPWDYTTTTGRDNPSKSPLYHEYTCLAKTRGDMQREDQLARQPPTCTRIETPLTKMGRGHESFSQKLVTRGPLSDRKMSGDFMKELEEKLLMPKSESEMGMSSYEVPFSASDVPCLPPKDFSPIPRQASSLPTPPRDPLGSPRTAPTNPFIPSRPRRQDSTSSPNQGPASTPMSTMAHGEVSPQSPTPSVGVRGRRITSVEDVPEDISSLSTADDLQAEFGFTTFRARQLERFVKDGWRPKING